jgi:hypothetical protein
MYSFKVKKQNTTCISSKAGNWNKQMFGAKFNTLFGIIDGRNKSRHQCSY